jgi:hypothetical protein
MIELDWTSGRSLESFAFQKDSIVCRVSHALFSPHNFVLNCGIHWRKWLGRRNYLCRFMNVTVDGVWLSAGMVPFCWIEIYEGLLLLCFCTERRGFRTWARLSWKLWHFSFVCRKRKIVEVQPSPTPSPRMCPFWQTRRTNSFLSDTNWASFASEVKRAPVVRFIPSRCRVAVDLISAACKNFFD